MPLRQEFQKSLSVQNTMHAAESLQEYVTCPPWAVFTLQSDKAGQAISITLGPTLM